MYNSQNTSSEKIEITRTIYPSPKSFSIGFNYWDVDCQIRINGKEEYHTITSLGLYQKTTPWLFEQWLLTGEGLLEQRKRREDRRPDGCNLMSRIKLAWSKFLGKFINFKSQ